MFKQIEPLKEEEELIELMVVLVLIFHPNVMLSYGPLRSNKMFEKKEKIQDKLLKGKSQLDKNNDVNVFKYS